MERNKFDEEKRKQKNLNTKKRKKKKKRENRLVCRIKDTGIIMVLYIMQKMMARIMIK